MYLRSDLPDRFYYTLFGGGLSNLLFGAAEIFILSIEYGSLPYLPHSNADSICIRVFLKVILLTNSVKISYTIRMVSKRYDP